MAICLLILLKMRNFSDKIIRKYQVQKHLYENLVSFEIMWKNLIQPYRPQMTKQYGARAFLVV